jgi:hypothetical protein
MPRKAKKLTKEQKRKRKEAKAERQRKYKWVMMNGKQVRIERPPTINGIPEDEYIEKYADPIWLVQNGMYEILHARESRDNKNSNEIDANIDIKATDEGGEIPF